MPTGRTGPGRRIQAIKRYRATTGTGLKEAKDAVERTPRPWTWGSTGSWAR
ncbi:ribosomal protein L7/L12 [Streptomyces sp. BF23-30]|uniref:ribosomal protein L7/L12 n=1 Tax=Streptomyces sp. BF23-30 TaxID=3240281 RepID=UPI0034E531F0